MHLMQAACLCRLVVGAYAEHDLRMLGSACSPPIRVMSNNDCPGGAADFRIDLALDAEWPGWAIPSCPQPPSPSPTRPPKRDVLIPRRPRLSDPTPQGPPRQPEPLAEGGGLLRSSPPRPSPTGKRGLPQPDMGTQHVFKRRRLDAALAAAPQGASARAPGGAEQRWSGLAEEDDGEEEEDALPLAPHDRRPSTDSSAQHACRPLQPQSEQPRWRLTPARPGLAQTRTPSTRVPAAAAANGNTSHRPTHSAAHPPMQQAASGYSFSCLSHGTFPQHSCPVHCSTPSQHMPPLPGSAPAGSATLPASLPHAGPSSCNLPHKTSAEVPTGLMGQQATLEDAVRLQRNDAGVLDPAPPVSHHLHMHAIKGYGVARCGSPRMSRTSCLHADMLQHGPSHFLSASSSAIQCMYQCGLVVLQIGTG